MQSSVELAVAGSAHPNPAASVAGPNGKGCDAGVHRETRLGSEPVNVRGFPGDLRRGQRSAARNGQQLRVAVLDEGGDPLLKVVDLDGARRDVCENIAGELGDQPVAAFKPASDAATLLGNRESFHRNVQLGVQLVQVPAEPVDLPRSFADQVFSAIHEKLQFSRRFIMRCRGEIGFTQHRPSNSKGIDRIRLASLPRGGPSVRHQLRRYPHDLLPGSEHVSLQPCRQMPAVLDAPGQVGPEMGSCPPQRPFMTDRGGPHRCLAEFAADSVDRDERVSGLVDIRANDDHHGIVSFQL